MYIRSIMSDTKKTGQFEFAENPKSKTKKTQKKRKLPSKISHNEKVA